MDPKPTTGFVPDQALRNLAQTFATSASRTVAVVGAGLSAPAGLPSWDALRRTLEKEAREVASKLDHASATDASFRVEDIQNTPDPWIAFDRLKTQLGTARYKDTIRSQLSPGSDGSTPLSYINLWKTPIDGILTLNLDDFSAQAYAQSGRESALKTFTGKQAGKLTHILGSKTPFLFKLHGELEDFDSWVFTRSELSSLHGDSNYTDLLRFIFKTYTVIFLGISADDISVGSTLTRIADLGNDGPARYWITDRRDAPSDRWADRANVTKILYPEGQHEDVNHALDFLRSAKASEPAAGPVMLKSTSSDRADGDAHNQMRRRLNAEATQVLASSADTVAFEAFLDDRDEDIHFAWYIPRKPEGARVLDYEIEYEVARGAFGRVYAAKDLAGSRVALKLLKPEIRTETNMLLAFRRGALAMRILDRHRLEGVPSYIEATEIPAMIVMPWIEGPTLSQLVEQGRIVDWPTVVHLMRDVVTIIRSAHLLPEHVLHRDVRPSNIMIEGGWDDDVRDWVVKVIDFDLATFHSARDKSVLAEGSALGYLAPEQLEKMGGSSTRSSLVDSFGLGMTLLFLLAGEEPDAYQHRSATFEEMVRRAAETPTLSFLPCLPQRFRRMIVGSTRDRQSERWDLAQIHRELVRLDDVHKATGGHLDGDLAAESILAASQTMSRTYDWNDDTWSGRYSGASGCSITVEGDPTTEVASLVFEWVAPGSEDWNHLKKNFQSRVDRALSVLRKGGWKDLSHNTSGSSSVVITSRSDSVASTSEAQRLADAVDLAMIAFQGA